MNNEDYAGDPDNCLKEVMEGVKDAWDFWLSQHDVSVPDLIHDAVSKVFTSWLDDHEEQILETIARQKLLLVPYNERKTP
jgi:hypothetical protein